MAKTATKPITTNESTAPGGRSFTVEADHPRNSDLLIQSIPGARLRSRIDSSKPVIVNTQSEDLPVPRDQARHLGSLPKIPGMTLTVNVAKRTYLIEDPLYDNKEMSVRIKRALQADGRPINRNVEINGAKPVEGELNAHRMKTLCREIRNLLNAKEANELNGTTFPEIESIDKLPGNYLLNPGSRIGNTQPQFEKDWDAWVEQLNRAGG